MGGGRGVVRQTGMRGEEGCPLGAFLDPSWDGGEGWYANLLFISHRGAFFLRQSGFGVFDTGCPCLGGAAVWVGGRRHGYGRG